MKTVANVIRARAAFFRGSSKRYSTGGGGGRSENVEWLKTGLLQPNTSTRAATDTARPTPPLTRSFVGSRRLPARACLTRDQPCRRRGSRAPPRLISRIPLEIADTVRIRRCVSERAMIGDLSRAHRKLRSATRNETLLCRILDRVRNRRVKWESCQLAASSVTGRGGRRGVSIGGSAKKRALARLKRGEDRSFLIRDARRMKSRCTFRTYKRNIAIGR